MTNDIDTIFAKSKSKKNSVKVGGRNQPKPQCPKNTAVARRDLSTPQREIKKPKQSKVAGTVNDPFALSSRSAHECVDRTEEGWRIYTPEELNIGKGGDTDLCPFDCNCCF